MLDFLAAWTPIERANPPLHSSPVSSSPHTGWTEVFCLSFPIEQGHLGRPVKAMHVPFSD